MPKYVGSLSTVMQTIRVLTIIIPELQSFKLIRNKKLFFFFFAVLMTDRDVKLQFLEGLQISG